MRRNRFLTHDRTLQLAVLSMMTALAVVLVWFRTPPLFGTDFLRYDAMDIPILLGGFLFGPLPGLAVAVAASLLRVLVHGMTNGFWGLFMDIIARGSFVLAAAGLFRIRPLLRRYPAARLLLAVVAGGAAMTGMMLLWNWLITPIYTGAPRAAVEAMLIPVFLPFNLMKAGINGAGAFLLCLALNSTLLKQARLRQLRLF